MAKHWENSILRGSPTILFIDLGLVPLGHLDHALTAGEIKKKLYHL